VKKDQYPESTGVLTADLCVHNVHCLAAEIHCLSAEILRLHEDLKAARRVVLSLAARVVAQSEILSRRAEKPS
jgi:hypothetical protein